MIRFGVGAGLLVIAFCASWLATMKMDANTGLDVRRMLWLFVFAVPLFSVIHNRGIRQAFWIGVLSVLVVRSMPRDWPLSGYAPQYRFTGRFTQDWADRIQASHFFVSDSIGFLGTLVFCVLCGGLSAIIYRRANGPS